MMEKKTSLKKEEKFSSAGVQGPETVAGACVAWKETGDKKGRGVFALCDFPKGAVLEVAPVIPVSKDSVVENGSAPDGYLLQWDGHYEDEEFCMPLGYIMMYNHHKNPNILIDQDYDTYTMKVIALRDIKAGEELCWNYNCELWFSEDE
ncbi:MAG: SET domain-containing protein-lysine N-methyltransferase [Micavibrio sp.]